MLSLPMLLMLSVSCTKDTGEQPYSQPMGSDPAFDENGTGKGWFSVSATKKVRFSRGCLQYQASTGTWRFAENQYDCIGLANGNISSINSGWIDLFGWGTSGWESGAVAYQPYSASTTNSDYSPGGDTSSTLRGTYAHADWGVHNAIVNGGNKPGMWRSLTNAEWNYLYYRNNSRKIGYATIAGQVKGVVFLPDTWSQPDGTSFTPAGTSINWNANRYTITQWSKMEEAGAVFIPAGGVRMGRQVYNVGTYAAWWTSERWYCYARTVDALQIDCSSGLLVRLVRVE